jgi:hypothetical protein
MYKLELSHSERNFLFQVFTIKADFSFSSEVYKPVYRDLADRMEQSLSDKSPVTVYFSVQEFEVLHATMHGMKGSVYSQEKVEGLDKQVRKKLKRLYQLVGAIINKMN